MHGAGGRTTLHQRSKRSRCPRSKGTRRRWNQRMRKKRKMRRSRQTGGRENDCRGQTGPLCSFVVLECFDCNPRRPHPALSKSWGSHWGIPGCTRLIGPQDLLTDGLSSEGERALVQRLSGTQHHACPLPSSCPPWSTQQSGRTSEALPLTADSSPLSPRRHQVEAEPYCSLS